MASAVDHAEYIRRLGDTPLILGQRLGEWIGHAPMLELEMAIANLGLDLLGQGKLFLDYAGEVEGAGRDADALAFKRDVLDYRNLLLVEQPNGDWAFTIARHFLFAAWQKLHLEQLGRSRDSRLAEIAEKAQTEMGYHLRFSREWVLRLGDGTEESHGKLQDAVDRLWRFTGEMFELDPLEEALVAEGIAVDLPALEAPWRAQVDAVFAEAGRIAVPELSRMTVGARKGHHTEHLGHILAELQYMQRAYPGLQW